MKIKKLSETRAPCSLSEPGFTSIIRKGFFVFLLFSFRCGQNIFSILTQAKPLGLRVYASSHECQLISKKLTEIRCRLLL